MMTRPGRRFAIGAVAAALPALAGSSAVLASMAWSYPQPLNSNAGTDGNRQDYYPNLATDGQGDWVAVWASRDTSGGVYGDDMDIFVARSTDNGSSWSAPAVVDAAALTDDLYDSSPAVYTDGSGHWLVVWESWDQGATSDIDLLYVVSTDGVSWSAPAYLNSDAGTDITRDHDDTPHMAVHENGHWVAVWFKKVDSPPGDEGDIYVSRSDDHGATWSPLSLLHAGMAIDPGNDIVPRIAADGAGSWVCTWRSDNLIGTSGLGDNDIHVSRSTDGGVTWTAPAALNTDAAADGLDDLEGTIRTGGNGTWLAAWYRAGMGGPDRDMLFARSTDNGMTWSAPAALNSNWATDTGDDAHPRLATDGRGHWVAVWYSEDTLGLPIGTDRDIFFVRSCDDGQSWTAPDVLNGNAGSDLSADDWSQEVALGANGVLLAAWYSPDSLGGTVGADRDILFARTTLFVCGDFDADGDVDLGDFGGFQSCYWPGGAPAAGCDVFDFDSDVDVDLTDFGGFEAALIGP
ncbi:MAG TPA: sialidase family protein [Phycisphaerae bacterium]|nr:sialidase family protein [Phycisphaerae bacterium]